MRPNGGTASIRTVTIRWTYEGAWTFFAGMKLFARVVETGGFSVVARELGSTQPTVSRTIAALEAHLGARLLNRSSRAVTLTDDGRQFYDLATRALEAVADAETGVGQRRGLAIGVASRSALRSLSDACTLRPACRRSWSAIPMSKSSWR